MTSEVIRFAPGLKPVLKHQQGGHDQKTHGQRAGAGGKTLRNQDDPMNPETAWVHEATWYHGTSRPDLDVLDARGRSRYPAQDRYYAIAGNNFATTDKELAAQYAREAADMDIAAGVEGVRPTVYRVVPTSDYFDPDPHSGPGGWNDGPEDMNEAFELHDNGSPVSVRFQDVMDIDGAFDANTGEELSVTKMLEALAPKPAVLKFAPGLRPVLKHQPGSHDQKTHGAWATGGASGDFSEWGSRAPQIREIAKVAPPLSELERLLQDPEGAIQEAMKGSRSEEEIQARVEEYQQGLRDMSDSELMRSTGTPGEQFTIERMKEGQTMREAVQSWRQNRIDNVEDYIRNVESRNDEYAQRETQSRLQTDMIEALTPGMRAVFEIEHPVTLPDGSSDLMEVSVRDVNWNGGLSSERPTVQVVMDVYNSDGDLISEGVQRAFRLGTDGKLEVENVYLKIDDDAYKGKGFATVFNERAYDAYISQGVESVTVGTAWDGGFVWANKGFAWDESAPFKNARAAEDALQRVLRDSKASAPTLERAATMLSDVQEQVSRAQPDVSKMPTPMEIAMLGYRDQGTGAFGSVETTVWPGKSALYDIRWKGRKELTPENLGGIARSKADMRRPQQIPGQQPLFDKNPVVQQPSTSTAGGRQSLDEEIMELLQPIGKAKKLSYWEKIEQQAEFYEKWIMETGRGLEEEDPDSMDDFFAAAVEAMPWLVE